MTLVRARLRLHPDGLLLLEPDSYLLLYEFTLPDLIYCGLMDGTPVLFSRAESQQAFKMVETSSGCTCQVSVRLYPKLEMVFQNHTATRIQIGGGHCG